MASFPSFGVDYFKGFLCLLIEVIIPFTTTDLCEAGFSSLLTIETKHRSCLVPKKRHASGSSTTAVRILEIVHRKPIQKPH